MGAAKIESLKQLRAWGLNTPHLLYEISQYMTRVEREQELDKFLSWFRGAPVAVKGGLRISIRTTRDGEFKTPHYPNHLLELKILRDLIREGYGIYIFAPIDPEDCLVRGNLFFDHHSYVSAEIKNGPGTVRELETGTPPKLIKNIYVGGMTSYWTPEQAIMLPAIMDLMHQVPMDLLLKNIFEFSIYRIPVGEKKEAQIFWEMRSK